MDLEPEYGGSVRFARPTMYNSKGKEIDVPICEKCGQSKQALIGQKAFMFLCGSCKNDESAK